jgi:hypothetical protein
MTKENIDLAMEAMYGSDNDYWKKARRKRIVFIPKKIGRENPELIKTDSFDFAKLIDGINKVSEVTQNVSNIASNVSGTVSSVSGAVKNVTSNAQQIASNVKTTVGSLNNLKPLIKGGMVLNTKAISEPYAPPVKQASFPPMFEGMNMLIPLALIVLVFLLFKK